MTRPPYILSFPLLCMPRNNQIGFIAALSWFASVTFLVSMNGVFSGPEKWNVTPNDVHDPTRSRRQWWVVFCYVCYGVSVVCSCVCTIVAVNNNLFLATVHGEHYDEYMHRIGGRLQVMLLRFFWVGMWLLAFSFFINFFFAIPWPANCAMAGISTVFVLRWMYMTGQGISAVYQLYEAGGRNGFVDIHRHVLPMTAKQTTKLQNNAAVKVLC